MSSLIHTLEFVKYFTFSNSVVTHHSPSAEYVDYENVQIVTPEGLTFKIKNMRFNYFKPLEKNIDSHIKVNWGDIIMQPSLNESTQNPSQDHIYIFHSNQFKNLPLDIQQSEINFFNTHVTTGGFWGHIYSIVIQVEGGNSATSFWNFMNMTKSEWMWNFLNVLNNAIYTTHSINELIKYPPRVIIEVLRSDPQNLGTNKLKDIISLIISYWNGTLSNISDEDKMELLFELMKLVSEDEAEEIYNHFFENGSYRFLQVRALLNDGDMLAFNMHLMKIYYMKIDMATYENEIRNLPKDHLIPIISEDIPFGWQTLLTVGPTPYFEMLSSGLKINEIKFHVYNIGNKPPVIELVGLENPFSIIQNKYYAYNEIIGLMPCFDRKELGLMRGMVYPIPAFAFEAFHKGLSKYYTIWDYINDLSNAAGIVFPFFKVIQAEAIVKNLFAIMIGEIGLFLDTSTGKQFSQKIQSTEKGKTFLYTYYFVSGFWGNLEQGKTIVDAFRKNKFKAMYDFENLLSAWGAFYADPNDFISIANDPTNRDKLVDVMNKIQLLYEDNKK
ncbi:hypothetical protein P0M11_11150 [Kaistella sp. PBT33-4]|uniref:hypothetical protein n=1 Tax=Kaistella sp. PBT33-4 TaxID=3032000 RepID=UPI0023D8ADC7|nr:hypothetical protein [Kaistella sp. PBT33-4]MDF0720554.1 hypothetical protein [Kaistella sp. PBT33-4]